jgi:hypothetical protein
MNKFRYREKREGERRELYEKKVCLVPYQQPRIRSDGVGQYIHATGFVTGYLCLRHVTVHSHCCRS